MIFVCKNNAFLRTILFLFASFNLKGSKGQACIVFSKCDNRAFHV